MPRRILLLLFALGGCGPRTCVSMAVPLEYTVTTTLAGADGATVVHRCRIFDQTDSIAHNFNAEYAGERHWIREAGGGLLVLGAPNACRWLRSQDLPAEGASWELRPHAAGPRDPDAEYLRDSVSLRFDSADDPTRLDRLNTLPLLAGSGAVWTLTVGGEPATPSLPAAFPWLAKLDEAEAARKAAPRQPYDPNAPKGFGSFYGIEATVKQLVNGATCEGLDPAAAPDAWVPLPRTAECTYTRACRPERPAEPCANELGGLVPRYADDRRRADFSLDAIDPVLIATLLRGQALEQAGAPFARSRGWVPEVCIDGQCHAPDPNAPLSLYLPARGLLAEVRAVNELVSVRDLVRTEF